MRNGNIISSLDGLVRALCLDYARRERAILDRTASHRTDTELRYYNFKIFGAAAEIVGEELAVCYIREIGEGIGYAKSAADGISELTYKKYKRLVMDNIAKRLHLKD